MMRAMLDDLDAVHVYVASSELPEYYDAFGPSDSGCIKEGAVGASGQVQKALKDCLVVHSGLRLYLNKKPELGPRAKPTSD